MDYKDKVMLSNLAKEYGLELATVIAVKNVESGGRDGFLRDGRPQILFEGHIMYRELKKKYGSVKTNAFARRYPNVVHPKWTRNNYKGGAKEYDRMTVAFDIDKECALKSASWGMFQVMGFNHKACGCDNIQQFLDKMKSTQGQIEAFFKFLESNNLVGCLKKKDWATFARRYNGPSYRSNRYDEKLAQEYSKFCHENQ